MIMPIGMDLLLCAIDARSGQVRFGPKLSYALPVAEMVHLVHAGRVGLGEDHLVVMHVEPTGEPLADSALSIMLRPETYAARGPLTVQGWAKWRGPRCIDRYLKAAAEAGIVKIVAVGESGDKMLTVVDPEPINQVTRRLIAVLDDPAPGFEDVAFAVLADAAAVARPHLHLLDRHRRARLFTLRHSLADGDAAQVLRAGREAITELSLLATADPRTFDEQIGLDQYLRIIGGTPTKEEISRIRRTGAAPDP
jgi:hypothetical protein